MPHCRKYGVAQSVVGGAVGAKERRDRRRGDERRQVASPVSTQILQQRLLDRAGRDDDAGGEPRHLAQAGLVAGELPGAKILRRFNWQHIVNVEDRLDVASRGQPIERAFARQGVLADVEIDGAAAQRAAGAPGEQRGVAKRPTERRCVDRAARSLKALGRGAIAGHALAEPGQDLAQDRIGRRRVVFAEMAIEPADEFNRARTRQGEVA